MIYHGTPSVLPPTPDDPKPGLWAVRCGPYKAHFLTGCAVMGLFGDRRCSFVSCCPVCSLLGAGCSVVVAVLLAACCAVLGGV